MSSEFGPTAKRPSGAKRTSTSETSGLPGPDEIERDDLALRWIKPARQERSRDTQDRIIDAAQRLLAKGRSWEELTVVELVAEADASVGAFYNRFRDKDALLHVLQIELYREGEATGENARAIGTSATVPVEVLVRAFVTLAVSSYRDQFGLRRALLARMHHDEQLRERAVELTRGTCEQLTDVLATRFRGERQRLRTTVEIAHRMVYGLLDQNLVFTDRPAGRTLSDGTLIDELSIAVLAYLQSQLKEQ